MNIKSKSNFPVLVRNLGCSKLSFIWALLLLTDFLTSQAFVKLRPQVDLWQFSVPQLSVDPVPGGVEWLDLIADWTELQLNECTFECQRDRRRVLLKQRWLKAARAANGAVRLEKLPIMGEKSSAQSCGLWLCGWGGVNKAGSGTGRWQRAWLVLTCCNLRTSSSSSTSLPMSATKFPSSLRPPPLVDHITSPALAKDPPHSVVASGPRLTEQVGWALRTLGAG